MAAIYTQIPAPRVPFLDPQTNMVSPQWFLWFNNLYAFTGSGVGIVQVGNGGTGLDTTPTNGKLLIGNGTGYSLNTLTAGAGVTVTNGAGTITLAFSGVTSFSAGTTGLTPSSPTTSAVVLAGTLAIANGGTGTTSTTFVNLAANVTGVLPVANGGTGTTSTTFVNLATNVTGVLPVANGGTGAGVAYTVATLPTPPVQGRRAWVTDALAPAFGAAVVGGGAVVIPVFDNGTAWIVG